MRQAHLILSFAGNMTLWGLFWGLIIGLGLYGFYALTTLQLPILHAILYGLILGSLVGWLNGVLLGLLTLVSRKKDFSGLLSWAVSAIMFVVAFMTMFLFSRTLPQVSISALFLVAASIYSSNRTMIWYFAKYPTN